MNPAPDHGDLLAAFQFLLQLIEIVLLFWIV
jgi:hypothetical protein